MAPVRVSVERALGALISVALAGAGALDASAGEPFQLCTKADRALFRTKRTLTPTPIHFVAPQYPRVTAAYEGIVEALALLRDDGYVHGVCVLSANPPGFFEQNAVEAIRRWRFAPADVARLPKEDKRVLVSVEFRLRDE